MTRTPVAAASALALIVAACAAEPAFAQNLQPSGLPARGAVAGTDVIVDQPAGSSTVQGAQASAIATFVQRNAAAGTSGQIQINSGGAFAGMTLSGDGTLSGSGALTVTKSNGTAFGTFAFQNFASLPSASGSPPISGGTVFPCIPTSTLDGCTGAQLLSFATTSVNAYGADPTGVADSTSAFQAALNSGKPFTCSGLYKITATLLVESPINDGQLISGGGSWGGPDVYNATPPPGACIIRPTSAVTKVFIIDGTPFVGGGAQLSWVQGFHMSNLVIDMVNMTDVGANAAINQIQAWDARYDNVRVINDGVNKRAWLLNGGAFTTQMNTVQGHIIDLEGTSSSFAVTTVTMTNPDIGRLIANYATGIRVEGGAIQTSTAEAVYLRNVGGIYLHTDIESLSGTCCAAYDMNNTVNGVFLENTMEGWTGPLWNGLPSALGFVDLDLTVAIYTPGCPFSITSGYENLNNCGTGANSNASSIVSGSLSQPQYFGLGRISNDGKVCIPAATNGCIGAGEAAGDMVLYSNGAGSALWLGGAQVGAVKVTSTAVTVLGGVTLNANQANFNSGSASTNEVVLFGTTGYNSGRICANAVANSCFGSEAVGDLSIGNYTTGGHLVLGAAGSPVRTYDGNGHEYILGYPQPTAGTGTASVSGNDNFFVATAGSTVTSSTVNFSVGGTGWASTPACLVSGNVATAFPAVTSISTSAVTIGWSASVSGAQATVRCSRHN